MSLCLASHGMIRAFGAVDNQFIIAPCNPSSTNTIPVSPELSCFSSTVVPIAYLLAAS